MSVASSMAALDYAAASFCECLLRIWHLLENLRDPCQIVPFFVYPYRRYTPRRFDGEGKRSSCSAPKELIGEERTVV